MSSIILRMNPDPAIEVRAFQRYRLQLPIPIRSNLLHEIPPELSDLLPPTTIMLLMPSMVDLRPLQRPA